MRSERDWSLAPQKQLCFRSVVRFLPAPEPARSVRSHGQSQPGVRGVLEHKTHPDAAAPLPRLPGGWERLPRAVGGIKLWLTCFVGALN